MPDFIECKNDIDRPDQLKPFNVNVTDSLVFIDRMLPASTCKFEESETFSKQYFVNLHEK